MLHATEQTLQAEQKTQAEQRLQSTNRWLSITIGVVLAFVGGLLLFDNRATIDSWLNWSPRAAINDQVKRGLERQMEEDPFLKQMKLGSPVLKGQDMSDILKQSQEMHRKMQEANEKMIRQIREMNQRNGIRPP